MIQFSRSQAGVKPIGVKIDELETELMANQSYCSGVKVSAGDECTYTVSTKQRMNRCKNQTKTALLSTCPCICYIAYVYPRNPLRDGL